jgi:hypothetical protein
MEKGTLIHLSCKKTVVLFLDKIATLLKSWSKTQQLRIANISKLRVRVVRGNQKYYGNINFTSSLSRTITTVSTLLLLTLRECTKLQPKGSSLCQSRKMNVQIFFADTRYRSAALQSTQETYEQVFSSYFYKNLG